MTDDIQLILNKIKVLMAPFSSKMADPEKAIEAYWLAIKDLDWVSEDHLNDAVMMFHQGKFEFLNSRFTPKPVDLRKMLEKVHHLKVVDVLRLEMPNVMAKPFSMWSDAERKRVRTLREALLAGDPYARFRQLEASRRLTA